MKRAFLSALLLLAPISRAQSPAFLPTDLERKAAEAGKSILASDLESDLPAQRLDDWLKTVAGQEPIWTGQKCRQLAGTTFVGGWDPSLCARAAFSTAEGSTVEIQVVVGTYGAGMHGTPKLGSSTFTSSDGESQEIKELGQLPVLLRAQIHPVGLLLGIRISREGLSAGEQEHLDSDYRTVFLARTLHGWKIMQAPELRIPTEKAWLSVGTVASEVEVKLRTYPENSFTSRASETKLWIRPARSTDPPPTVGPNDALCSDSSTDRTITFVNDRYIAVDELFTSLCAHYDEGRTSWFASLEKPDERKKLSSEAGVEAFQLAEKIAMKAGPPEEACEGYGVADTGWLIARSEGHWQVQARLTGTGGGTCSRFTDLVTLPIPPPATITGWDELPFSWKRLRALVPDADDAFWSPRRDFLISRNGGILQVRPYSAGRLQEAVASFPIPAGAVVMTIWTDGVLTRDTLQFFRSVERK